MSRRPRIVLAWTAVPAVGGYHVELADAANKDVHTWNSPYAGLTTDAASLTEGNYCYRVRADDAARSGSP